MAMASLGQLFDCSALAGNGQLCSWILLICASFDVTIHDTAPFVDATQPTYHKIDVVVDHTTCQILRSLAGPLS
jgi:hypothetical protein